MAHYKRKKSRSRSGSTRVDRERKERLTALNSWYWLGVYPAYWHIIFHTRPTRRHNRALAHKIVKGEDPDEFEWRDGRKPHIYYW